MTLTEFLAAFEKIAGKFEETRKEGFYSKPNLIRTMTGACPIEELSSCTSWTDGHSKLELHPNDAILIVSAADDHLGLDAQEVRKTMLQMMADARKA